MARLVGALGRVLITAGALLLAFAAFQLWGTGMEESGHQDDLGAELSERLGAPSDSSAGDVATELEQLAPTTAPSAAETPEGEAAGVIRISKIGLEKIFVSGTSKTDLKKGPGHYLDTPMPGQVGNAAIAGHRTTYGAPFNRIDELVPDDRIETFTLQGKFVYEVVAPPDVPSIERGPGWWSVRPTQSDVIGPVEGGGNWLTLTACHPKYSAEQRIIVRAQLVADTPPAPSSDATEPPGTPANPGSELDTGLGGDPDALFPAILLGLAAAAVWLIAWLVARRWKRWPAVLVGIPAFGVLLWFCFVFVDRWLPSV